MVSIQKIDQHNVWRILKLEVDETQKEFVATNTESIVEAYTTIVPFLSEFMMIICRLDS